MSLRTFSERLIECIGFKIGTTIEVTIFITNEVKRETI